MKQLALLNQKIQNQFGGSLQVGRRKAARPLAIKKSIHLVLKAADGSRLLRKRAVVRAVLKKFGAKFGVKIYSLAVHDNHIHVSLKIHSRHAYRKWIRATTSRLVARVSGLKFTLRPWTRILAWGHAFRRIKGRPISFWRPGRDWIGSASE